MGGVAARIDKRGLAKNPPKANKDKDQGDPAAISVAQSASFASGYGSLRWRSINSDSPKPRYGRSAHGKMVPARRPGKRSVKWRTLQAGPWNSGTGSGLSPQG